MISKYRTTSTLALLTPVLLIGVVFLMGGGHGFHGPAIMLFPTGLISFSLVGSLEIPFMILAVLQFPIYGFLIDKSDNKPITLLLIISFHMILALVTLFTIKDL
jgi:hypothetical protein